MHLPFLGLLSDLAKSLLALSTLCTSLGYQTLLAMGVCRCGQIWRLYFWSLFFTYHFLLPHSSTSACMTTTGIFKTGIQAVYTCRMCFLFSILDFGELLRDTCIVFVAISRGFWDSTWYHIVRNHAEKGEHSWSLLVFEGISKRNSSTRWEGGLPL